MKKDETKKDYMEFMKEWEKKYIPETLEEESEFDYVGNPELLGEDSEYFDDDEFIVIDGNEEDDYELPSCVEEDEEILDIPQGDYEEFSAIDENYVPDDWEKDLFYSPEDDIIENVESIEEIIEAEDMKLSMEKDDLVNKIGSSIKISDDLNEKAEVEKERNKIDDKISKNIAKEVLDEKTLSSVDLLGDDDNDDDQPNWINQDMFGNDIESIIAEPPQDEDKHEDDDFVEGTFDKWREENK